MARNKGPRRDKRGRFVSKKAPHRDARGRFVPRALSPRSILRTQPARPVRVERARDAQGRFVPKAVVRTDYVREIEALRREVERLKTEGKEREKDISRNYKKRGGAFDQFVSTLALGQRARLEKYLDDVYDGKISKEDFITLAVGAGLTVREAWAVLYS
jgi:hypothetical protein